MTSEALTSFPSAKRHDFGRLWPDHLGENNKQTWQTKNTWYLSSYGIYGTSCVGFPSLPWLARNLSVALFPLETSPWGNSDALSGHVPRFLPLEMPRLLFAHGYQCQAPGEWDPETPLLTMDRGTNLVAKLNNHFLLYGSESQVYTPAQITELNALHFKALRAILRVNSSYYHRVLHPSDAPCSNEHLLSLAYPHAPYVYPPSLAISNARIRLLGHILRHPADIEHSLCFNKSLTLRTISSPYRRGAPRAHWPEIVLAESQFRFLCLINGTRPEPGNFLHPFYTHCTLQQLREWVSPPMPQWYNTTRQMHQLSPLAQEREFWKQLFPWIEKPKALHSAYCWCVA